MNRWLTEMAPAAAGAWWRLGICCVEANDFTAARTAFTRVVELEPHTGQGRAAQAKLERIGAPEAAAGCSSTTEALKAATACRARRELTAAMVWNERAVAVAQTTAEETRALAEWAAALRGEREFKKALALLHRSIASQPDKTLNRVSYTVLVATLTDAGRLAEAESVVEGLLAKFPQDPYVLRTAGRTFMALHAKSRDSTYRERADACFARAGGRRAG